MKVYRERIPVDKRIKKVLVYDMLLPEDIKLAKDLLGVERFNNISQDAYAANLSHTLLVVTTWDKENAKFGWKLCSYNDVYPHYKAFSMFSREYRSDFNYWFAHWCAFQLTALNLHIWKFKFLFHDFEKPWMKLFYRGDYKKVQKWHRTHNSHHLEYGLEHGWDRIDWEALVVDWECCGLTKRDAQLDARETLEYEISRKKWKPYAEEILKYIEPVLERLEL